MTELEKIQADMAFYAEVGPMMEELELSRANKANDPVRFAEAKQVFSEAQRDYRLIAEYLMLVEAQNAGADVTIVAGTIGAVAEVIAPAGTQGVI